jgi:hypothetical protein
LHFDAPALVISNSALRLLEKSLMQAQRAVKASRISPSAAAINQRRQLRWRRVRSP